MVHRISRKYKVVDINPNISVTTLNIKCSKPLISNVGLNFKNSAMQFTNPHPPEMREYEKVESWKKMRHANIATVINF